MKQPIHSVGTHRLLPRRLAMFVLMAVFGLSAAVAQMTIKGTVVDSFDDPLAGVSIIVKGSKSGTSTDLDGNYSIQAKKNDVLQFRYIGTTPVDIKVTDQKVIDVKMEEDNTNLEEVVVVGYQQVKRGSITGAVSSVSSTELLKAPTMSMSNVVGSRVAGIAAKQTSGQPGEDNAALTLRGQSGIVYVIDGIRRTSEDFNQIDPNEIDQVSVLKDAASVAIYGLDANGVIIVTTKKGITGKSNITYTGTVGISQNANNQEWLDGPGYAYWFNKAQVMNGYAPVFTESMVESMRLGINGFGNTNWYNELYGTGFRTNHNISASGGTDNVKYFASIGYLKEDGNVDGFGFDRWNIRTNIDANITKNLKFTAGVSGRIQNQDNPYYGADPDGFANLGSQMVRMMPFMPKTVEIDGQTYFTGNDANPGPFSMLNAQYNNGYNRKNSTYVATNFSLQYDAPFLKGLSFKVTGAYDMAFFFNKLMCNPNQFAMIKGFRADYWNVPEVLEYTLTRSNSIGNLSLTESASKQATLTGNFVVQYNNRFGAHQVGAMFLGEARQFKSNAVGGTGYGLDFVSLDELSMITNSTLTGSTKYPSLTGSSSTTRTAGFGGRLDYNYDDKYFAQATLRYDGSYLFGGLNKRWVVLPGVSAGWRIDREDFFQADWVQNLKLRAGFGRTASTSGLSPFIWRNSMGLSKNGVVIGTGSTSYISATNLGNPYLRWSTCDNYNIGVDASLWKGLLSAEVDVFYKYEHNKIASAGGSYPPSMGGYYFTQANLNKVDYKGFDLTLTHQNRIDKVNYGAKLIWSYAYARYLFVSGDSDNTPEYQRLTGKQVGAKYGFLADGLYQTQEEIDNGPTPDHSPKGVMPGQIKYIDRNGDGRITYGDDMGYVGRSNTPTHTGSLDLWAEWNGFDVDILFGWGLGHDVAMTGVYTASTSAGIMDGTSYTVPFKWYGNSPTYLVEQAWRPDNTDAAFPRLYTVPMNNNDAYASTYWYRKGDYLRFKTAQLGYTIPQKLIAKSGITKLRVYLEGYNLFTWSGLVKYNIDPESPAVNNGYYPQQRKMAFGINLSF